MNAEFESEVTKCSLLRSILTDPNTYVIRTEVILDDPIILRESVSRYRATICLFKTGWNTFLIIIYASTNENDLIFFQFRFRFISPLK